MTIRIPMESLLPMMPALSEGFGRSFSLDPAVKKISVSLPKRGLTSPLALFDSVRIRFPKIDFRIALKALRRFAQEAARMQENGEMTFTAVIHSDREWLAVESGDTTNRNYGIAIDLGTTTIVVELIDLNTGYAVDTAARLNSQAKYGADVMSRITAAYTDPEKIEELRTAVIGDLNGIIGGLLRKHHLPQDAVYEAVVAGNTAMNHLFLGLPVATLAVSPYSAVFSVLPSFPASETGLAINPFGKVYIVPNVRSFVGGDISAGLTAIDLEQQKGNFLFIDLGTNGEIVLKQGACFTATSTAAGPAFEGMTISCGILALPGAVFKVGYRDKFFVQTIADKASRGVCGTGLIDLIAVSLDRGIISPQGHIRNPSKKIDVTRTLSLSQKDVREVQLATAAVKTGIRMLLAKLRMTTGDLDGIYVAGAFGNYLNVANAVKLGLLPRFSRNKIFFVGNSSLAGARVLLLSQVERARCARLVRKIRHVSLAKSAEFQKMFVEALEFKAWN